MNTTGWPRVLLGGVLWAVVYNGLWGAAWFGFMRREWLAATVAVGKPMPWTADVWLIWMALTIPIGVVIAAYAAGRAPGTGVKPLLCATLALWLMMTIGMVVWGRQESYSVRILALDSVVNVVAMAVASLAGARVSSRN